jgi:hypothetical protein
LCRTNDTQDIIEKVIWKFLEANKELVLRRVIGTDGFALTAGINKDITIDTYGTGKALYNGVEIGSGGGGEGGGGYVDRIIGKDDCLASVQQPMVICSPPDAPCEVHVIAGKEWKNRLQEVSIDGCKSVQSGYKDRHLRSQPQGSLVEIS